MLRIWEGGEAAYLKNYTNAELEQVCKSSPNYVLLFLSLAFCPTFTTCVCN